MMINNLHQNIWNKREMQNKGALGNEKKEEDFLKLQIQNLIEFHCAFYLIAKVL